MEFAPPTHAQCRFVSWGKIIIVQFNQTAVIDFDGISVKNPLPLFWITFFP